MADQIKDILTTADTAKLLGVSVRTAQLLIEGGTIASWKTPGGHRRVYRSDVLGIIEGRQTNPPSARSAKVIFVAASERLDLYERLFAEAPECAAEGFSDFLDALVAVGSVRPHAIVVDIQPADPDRAPLLHSLATNPLLGETKIFAVAKEPSALFEAEGKVIHVATPEDAVAALRASLADPQDDAIVGPPQPFPIALNERQRLVALERSGLVEAGPDESFDRLTWLAAQMLEAPIALMTLLTSSHQRFKSRVGLDLAETPRSWAFCNHTILQKGEFSVEDLATDMRFSDNPAVAGEPHFRFYAGAPVLDEDGYVIGSLCVLDHVPRKLDDRGMRAIETLAALATDQVRLRALDRKMRNGA